ncbi:MAG: glycoside hydrolase family 127 protein, partial [Dysgonamonadaceae bacterium]|nr:glycoside hydrolase family 127 protein [Dysgonamonadaceae bacterium]
MKKKFLIITTLIIVNFQFSILNLFADYPIQQVKLKNVELTDNFWLPKIRTVQEKTIAYSFAKCEEEGRMTNFVTAGDVIRGKQKRGEAKALGKMVFDDTDVYKTIEGAAYSLINAPNPQLDKYLDSVITLIAYAQEPDGYLATWRTINPKKPTSNWVRSGGGRWFDLGSSHELYNAGHLYEAASAHYWATGKRNFLDIALKNADLLVKTFMTEPVSNLHLEFPGHQIAETGLIKLWQITGKQEYLQLAKQFLDNRGKTNIQGREAYRQDHKPVIEQDEVVGHAVRAVYMYAGMTDIAAIYGDSAYRAAIEKLWYNMTGKKMYITGGLGALHNGEAFGKNYELPNLTAYAETCAAIGGVYWAERMFRLSGNARYFNVLERMLYNGVIAGISESGTEFFYCNPLASDGKYRFNQGLLTRGAWFDCSCCPTNLIRFLPYVPNLIYATQTPLSGGRGAIYVNLFIANKAKIELGSRIIDIEQKTDYPWNGNVEIAVNPDKQTEFTVKIRIPSWVRNEIAEGGLYHYSNEKGSKAYSVKINGKALGTA